MAKFVVILGFMLLAMRRVCALHSTDTITSAGNNTRSGHLPNHNMDPNIVKSGTFDVIWRTKGLSNWKGFTEQFYAQNLVYTPSGQKQFVYAISAQNHAYRLDAITGEILAHRVIHIPFLVVPDLEGCNDISDCIGSTGTGVIDPGRETWYFTTKTYKDQTINTPQGKENGRYYIHAVDVMTLEEKPNFPIPLEGLTADNAPWRVFESGKHHQRPALMQIGDYVYAGFASHCVQWNYSGWIMGWHADQGRLSTKYATQGGHETSGIGGGIWMSGGGLASDNPGRMFFATGNGYASQLADDPVPGRQPPTALEEAVVNMAINEDGTLTPTDFFMPWEKRDLDGMDKDLGTSGFILMEPSVFSTPSVKQIGCVAGKTGKLYFLNMNDLGGYQMGPNRKDAALQVVQMEGPVFASGGTYPYEGGYVYITPVGHETVAFKFGTTEDGMPIFTRAGMTQQTAAGRQGVGHSTITTMNGTPGTGILWIVDVDGTTLRAYGTVPVDGILPTYALLNNFGQTKFSRPTFGNGKIYVNSHTGFITAFGSPVNMPLNCSSPYDAGTVKVGNSSTTEITCKALIPLSINNITLDSTANFNVSGYPTLPYAMKAGDTVKLKASFKPVAVGPLSTNINFNTTNGGTVKYASNTPVVIRGVATSVAPVLSIAPNVLSFNEVVTGNTGDGEQLSFAIANKGLSPLVITSYRWSTVGSAGPYQSVTNNAIGPFKFKNLPPVNSTVPGNDEISITVNFKPDFDGYWESYLVITTNGGSTYVGAFGTSGSPPVAVLEWQRSDGTWQKWSNEEGFTFQFDGGVALGQASYRTIRVRNTGGTILTTSVSKPPTSGALAAVGALGAIAEGSQIPAKGSLNATMVCSPPKGQVNKDDLIITANWTMNNNDATWGKHVIKFQCNGKARQVGPLDSASQAYFRYFGCWKDADPERMLDTQLYYTQNNTNGRCQTDCYNAGYNISGTQYEGECWCGHTAARRQVPDTDCDFLCLGDYNEYCGGDVSGALMSMFYDRRVFAGPPPPKPGLSTSSTNSPLPTPPSNSTTTAQSKSATSTPTLNPDYTYLGCVNEGNGGRALAKDSLSTSDMTISKCQDYCTSKGYPLSGVEYGQECFCGYTLEYGAKINGSTECTMNCAGTITQTCGGPSALSVYNYTLYEGPRVISSVNGYAYLGCYTEGQGERALSDSATSASNMTVAFCTQYCSAAPGSYKYAGLEYSTECYCGNEIKGNANKTDTGCDMLCGGDSLSFCGGPSRLNLYAMNSTISKTSSSFSLPTSTQTLA